MKPKSALVLTVLLSAVLFTTMPTAHAQPRLTAAQVAALQPADPGRLPKSGTFFVLSSVLSDRPMPPTPCVPKNLAGAPIYSIDQSKGEFLIDDSPLLEQQQTMMMSEVPNPGEGGGSSPPPAYPEVAEMIAAVQAGTAVPLPANSWSPIGAFWSIQRSTYAPVPFYSATGCDVYLITNAAAGSYLVDDRQYSYPATSPLPEGPASGPAEYPPNALYLRATGSTNGDVIVVLHGTVEGVGYSLLSKTTLDPAQPWIYERGVVGAAGTETRVQVARHWRDPLYFWAHVGLEAGQPALWVELTGITNTIASLVLHGTLPGVAYDIQTNGSVWGGQWATATTVLGPEGQDWVATTLMVLDPAGMFFRAKSGIDTDGSGLPDWWQLEYFGHTGVDPYGDEDTDGWTNLQEYQNGTHPRAVDTSPPPRNLTARLDGTGTNVLLTWESGGGPVSSYVVLNEGGWAIATNGPATMSFLDIGSVTQSEPWGVYLGYYVRAYFPDGSFAQSGLFSPCQDRLTFPVTLVRGPECRAYVAVGAAPSAFAALRVCRINLDTSDPDPVTNVLLNASSFVQGVAELPSGLVTPTMAVWVQALDATGRFGATVWPEVALSGDGDPLVDPGIGQFLDARRQVKENLKFLLRSATLTTPFRYSCGLWPDGNYEYPYLGYTEEPEDYFARPSSPGGYEYYGYTLYSLAAGCAVALPTRPVQENFLWRNFIYDPADFDSGGVLTNGAGEEAHEFPLRRLTWPTHWFGGPAANPLPFAFSWMVGQRALAFTDSPEGLLDLGVVPLDNQQYYLPAGLRNLYGLTNHSVLFHARGATNVQTLYAEGPSGSLPWGGSLVYPEVEDPVLQTVGYYFASQTPGFRYSGPLQPFPGSPDFSNTNSSPPLITGFGQSITVAGWAQQAILNGDSNKFAYLQQYFDKGYKLDAGGGVVAEIGVLSPYGVFFPTEPGPTALVTLPDIDPPYQRGTGVVHVIKLQLDVNHDGFMDLSFAGPDNASEFRPFAFWVNNDYDRLHRVDGSDLEQDDLERVDGSVYYGQTDGNMDCAFRGYEAKPAIPCARDLEDYTRLWLPGLSSLMAVMPTNYTVKLTLNGDGQIRLFRAVETDGGTNYLFDELTASNQVAQSSSLYVGLMTSSSPIILTDQSEHFIWCGAKRGTAEVHLQVLDGSQNVLADTAAYIELKDIKEMYERWTVGESASRGPYDYPYRAVDDMPTGTTSFQYGPPESTSTPYILLVHGWNMKRWEKDRYAETAFKRLYWQGYQGRFGFFRWPTGSGFDATIIDIITDANNYDKSEFNAWKSAPMLRALLRTNLNAQYPGRVYLMAHSMGNIVAGEALRTNTPLVQTYIAMQAAVPSHSYDGSAPARTIPAPLDDQTFNYYAHYWQSNSPPYFNGAAGAASYVNFYNTNDYALENWKIDQNLKPADTLNYAYWQYPGTNYFTKGLLQFTYLSFPADTHEIFSFCDEARCFALGAQANMAGFSQLDLMSLWPPDTHPQPHGLYSAHAWHSAQFRSNNMKQETFWRTLLGAQGFDLH